MPETKNTVVAARTKLRRLGFVNVSKTVGISENKYIVHHLQKSQIN